MQLWLDNVEKIIGRDAGSFTGGGKKVCLHTTEGGSIAGALGAYASHGGYPHFTIDFNQKRRIQHIPLNLSARALANNTGDGFQTNRANVIQIEIVGYSRESHLWTQNNLDFIIQLLQDIKNAGHDYMLQAPQFYGNEAYGLYAKQRMTDANFVSYSGIVGHQHVPDNDHWDCGKINIQYILDKLGGVLTPTSPPVVPVTPPNTIVKPAFPLPVGHWFGVPNRDIRNHSGFYGSDVPKVKLLQQLLNKHGYMLAVDGMIGNATKNAIMLFQRTKGLAVDGLVGQRTWDKL